MTPLWSGYVALTHQRIFTLTKFATSQNTVLPRRRSASENPFLDGMVVREGDTVCTTVYHKPTHMDRYLHYTSHHCARQLLSSVRSLRDRAINIYLQTGRHEELTHLTQVFHSNGYPEPLVMWVLARIPPAKPTEDDDHAEELKQFYLPYVKGVRLRQSWWKSQQLPVSHVTADEGLRVKIFCFYRLCMLWKSWLILLYLLTLVFF